MGKVFFRVLSWCPGALGLFLRQRLFPLYLGSCGKKVLFGRFVRLHGARSIHIGDHSVIGDHVLLDARRGRTGSPVISVGAGAFVGTGSRLRSKGGKISIGAGSSVGSYCRIVANGSVKLEEDVLLAAFCVIGVAPAGRSAVQPATRGTDRQDKGEGIVIGAGSWLGVRSVVFPGARVGRGTVVGAHTLVRDRLPERVVAVGRPARILRERGEGRVSEAEQ